MNEEKVNNYINSEDEFPQTDDIQRNAFTKI